MKFRTLLILLFLSHNSTYIFGQYRKNYSNALKTNLTAAATRIYSLQYEKRLTDHLALNVTGFYREKSDFLFSGTLDNVAKKYGLGITGVDFQYIFIDQAKIGVKGFSPELRYYFGNKPSRFFMSVFGQMEYFDMMVPASLMGMYRGQTFEFVSPIDFDIRTMSGGVLVGKQFRWNRVGLDFVLIGPHFGKARKVYAEANSSMLGELNDEEKAYIRQSVIERFKLDQNLYGVSVGDEQADIRSVKKVPYFGLRGVGLNVFYYF